MVGLNKLSVPFSLSLVFVSTAYVTCSRSGVVAEEQWTTASPPP